ncbi:DNA-binding protein [Microbacterium sp. HMWF026]|uniref:Rv2175c family DNA-binding protein n=1 Tax=Microbacterium sp. HMWF026 TaxID=2056861 RepID=UPI000D361E89|nr:Rv2175c family DNA-binding protein [Microbacterium sp. HMWF026]PTT14663.1 DNA-binding protein [Microbacterium sp. HMWF026]
MTENSRYATEWLTIPDLVELLDEPLGKVRRLIDENYLVGSRRDGVFKVPAVFVVDGRPLPSLRGTIIVLHDAGFDPDETIDWLLTPEETIGVAPIEALLAGRKSEVRRVAATLA